MNHKVAGYDKRTELLVVEHSVPSDRFDRVRALARLSPDDDGVGCYPLDDTAAVSVGLSIDRPLDPNLYDWFLEPAAQA